MFVLFFCQIFVKANNPYGKRLALGVSYAFVHFLQSTDYRVQIIDYRCFTEYRLQIAEYRLWLRMFEVHL